MKIVCIKMGYQGRSAEASRDFSDRFETDIFVYGQPGLAIYPKESWQLLDSGQEEDSIKI